MASKLFMEGKQLTGAVGNALKINCKDKDGNKSTVQTELNKLYGQNSVNVDTIQWWIDNGYLPDPSNIRTYLYCLGNLCEDITGGWDTILSGSVKQYSRYMEYTYSGSARNAFATTNMITFPSTAKKLCIHYEYLKITNSASNVSHNAEIFTSKYENSGTPTSVGTFNYTKGEYSDYTIEIAINQAITGYVYPLVLNAPSAAWTIVARIDKIWYE